MGLEAVKDGRRVGQTEHRNYIMKHRQGTSAAL